MVEYSTVNVKLSNSQLNKLKSAVKKQTRNNFTNELLEYLMEIIYLMNCYNNKTNN